MKNKHIAQIILMILALTAKTLSLLTVLQLAHFKWIRYSSIPADMIFLGVLLSLLILQKEQKWLIWLGKISLVTILVKDILELFSQEIISAGLAVSIVKSVPTILILPYLALYICLFFTKPGPLRIYFRWLAACTLFGVVCGIFTKVLFIMHSPLSRMAMITYPIVFVLEYLPLFLGVVASAKEENISRKEELLANFPEMQGID